MTTYSTQAMTTEGNDVLFETMTLAYDGLDHEFHEMVHAEARRQFGRLNFTNIGTYVEEIIREKIT